VLVDLETAIGERLAQISSIRALSQVWQIGNVNKKPFMTAGPATGWVGETDARSQIASPVLDELAAPAIELYAMPAATASLLEDSTINLDDWLTSEIDQVFAEQESTAFVSGDNRAGVVDDTIYFRGLPRSWKNMPASSAAIRSSQFNSFFETRSAASETRDSSRRQDAFLALAVLVHNDTE
jgi:HK97 family phage major capsid protein